MYKKTDSNLQKRIEKMQILEKDSWVILHKKYKSLSKQEYDSLIQDWDFYYQMVRLESPMYSLFKDSYKAVFIDKDFKKAKENSLKAKEWLINGKRLPSPSESDPRLIANKQEVMTYNSLKNLNAVKSDFADI